MRRVTTCQPPWTRKSRLPATVALTVERIGELARGRAVHPHGCRRRGTASASSAYEYRRTGRGGQGLIAHDLSRGGRLVASFPVEDADEILLVSDQGQLIRVHPGRIDPQTGRPSIRVTGRNTRGVIIFRKGDNEHVVSVERIEGGAGGQDDAENGDDAAGEDGASEDGGAPDEA